MNDDDDKRANALQWKLLVNSSFDEDSLEKFCYIRVCVFSVLLQREASVIFVEFSQLRLLINRQISFSYEDIERSKMITLRTMILNISNAV
jgi:hypothetical protein